MTWAPLHRSEAQSTALAQIRARLDADGEGAAAVFDLDGCVFDNRPRQVRIFHEFASAQQAWSLYRVAPEHFEDWDFARTFRNAGLDPDRAAELAPGARRFWFERFFHDDYVVHDVAMPGAPQLVRRARLAGAHVVYLTGRYDTMRPGTARSLATFGFPWDEPGVTLITKPSPETPDADYKAAALEQIERLGRPIVLMDNEPVHVNLFKRRYPDACVAFLDTDHSPTPIEPEPGVLRLHGFLG